MPTAQSPLGRMAVVAIDGGELTVGGGLLAVVRPALRLLEEGGIAAVLSSNASVVDDLPSWCRAEGHEYLGSEKTPAGARRHLIGRGRFSLCTAPEAGDTMPERADPMTGFAPRGADVEPGGPVYPFDLVERDHLAPLEIRKLYEQAVAAQWNASRDIPWEKAGGHAPALEAAVVQIMTFLAENEFSALYLPSKFISRIHPAYAEVSMFLATQLADEARHIEVFLRRARLSGPRLGVSSVTTSRSLLSLLELSDFSEAAFLLSVLGEGTFLDLLAYVERHAPDEATAELVHRARTDESRHVHFGLAHVRAALACDATLYARLEQAVRHRAATLYGVAGVPAPVQDALIILAARGTEPGAVADGHEAFRELLNTMHASRVKRLLHAGFTAEQADTISQLHTANFM